MDVVIDQQVHFKIMNFYEASKRLHITLDGEPFVYVHDACHSYLYKE